MTLKVEINTGGNAKTDNFFASSEAIEATGAFVTYSSSAIDPAGESMVSGLYVLNAQVLPETSALMAVYETLEILNDPGTMQLIRDGKDDINAGRWVSWDVLRDEP